jgi:hypothetical protein
MGYIANDSNQLKKEAVDYITSMANGSRIMQLQRWVTNSIYEGLRIWKSESTLGVVESPGLAVWSVATGSRFTPTPEDDPTRDLSLSQESRSFISGALAISNKL